MPIEFQLHPRLESDTFFLGSLPLCRVHLMNEARYPWLILVPQRAGLEEILDLDEPEKVNLIEEISLVSARLKAVTQPDKLNVASIGNLVPQLHVHIVARFKMDAAWPNPVWGRSPPEPYTAQGFHQMKDQLSLMSLPNFSACART